MAIAEVKNGASIYSASKKNGIPEQTLRRWIVKSPSHQGPGRSPFLSQEEEKCIVQAVKFLSKCGIPFNRKDILNVVETYLLSSKELSHLFPNGKPGIEWVRGFEKRWKGEIGKRKPELLTKARAKDMCEETANAFFNIYENVLLSNGLLKEPGRIFHLHETGLSTDPRSSKIFLQKESRTAYLKFADCGKAMYTVLFCISAAGEYLPPFVVYKGQNLYQSWMTGGPQGTLYGCTESGWMQDFLFETWMKFFIDFVKNFKKPVLLIYDGHGSHLTYNSIKLAMDNGIILLCLPPNSSHALQPLDVGVFSPMKNTWRDVLKTWYRESRLQNVSKANFPFLLRKLFEKIKATNAVNGFRGTGLYPLNRNAIQHRIIPTEKNPTVAATNKSSASSKVSALLDSHMKEANLLTVSPTPSANTVLAMDNFKKKRKRVQSKSGEILTQENVLKRLAMEEEDRKKKCNLGQVPKRKDQKS